MNLRIRFEPLFLLPIIGLSGISLFIISSTTPDLLVSQATSFIVGFIFFIIFSRIDTSIWSRFLFIIYLVSLFLLASSFLGPSIRGSTRWLDLGIFRFQPSEIIKPFIIVVMASYISSKKNLNLGNFFRIFLILSPVLFLIFRQPDLGNVLVYLFVFIILVIYAGLDWRYILAGSLVFAFLLPFSWHILADYQRQRLISFISPESDPLGSGYNAMQAMIALGSGGFWGLGLGRGTQSKLLFLPEYHTDFVFASLGEELGFLGGLAVIVFYFLLLGKTLMVSTSSDDLFEKLVGVGVFAQIFVQVFINIGMNMGILPITGITLPLVSYGGNSIISTLIGLGMVAGISVKSKHSPLVIS